MPTVDAPVARVLLKPRKALPFFSRHPWVFAGAIQSTSDHVAPGDEVIVQDDVGRFVARGIYNSNSNIAVRLYSWQEDEVLDEAFWSRRLDEAISLRRSLFPSFDPDSACRLVFSEADGLSGLTVDRYGDWLLIQLTSFALASRKDILMKLLQKKLQPRGIWLRTEKGIREAEGLELADGLLSGEAPPRPLIIRENGVQFALDVAEGQKTGFFLDQRDNRRRVSEFVRGQRVLDICCYTGGFSLNCLVNGGAQEVLAVDMSESALTLARSNAELNGVGDRLKTLKRDCFKAVEELAAAGERFDTVILDPPKLARNRQGIDAALRGYYSLNRSALSLLKPGGLLVTCSCSGHVSSELFVDMLAQAALHENRRLQILEARGAAADHPTSVTCLETEYLKCYLCRAV
ncbi:MAG: class I SAM-dependent rRNA methyltransferase [Planctomycetes bacterium]|nr:class I SAM-dependent rRNA methyltransferase [Planctomycetota bacterium]